jgi:hypothetical protein
MADFLRALGMQQLQQQQLQQQQQQRNNGFGLGPPGVSIGQSSASGTSFPDVSGNNLGSGFNPQNVQQNNNGNNPMAQMNAEQLQALQQTRNVNMLSRQLELMGMAQNQQPQNGPVGTGSRLGQQQLGQNGFQQGMGASPAGGGVQPGSGTSAIYSLYPLLMIGAFSEHWWYGFVQWARRNRTEATCVGGTERQGRSSS